MAQNQTSFSVSKLQSVEQTQFANIDSKINKIGKFDGKYAWNNTDSVVMQATNELPSSEWVSVDASITILPE